MLGLDDGGGRQVSAVRVTAVSLHAVTSGVMNVSGCWWHGMHGKESCSHCRHCRRAGAANHLCRHAARSSSSSSSSSSSRQEWRHGLRCLYAGSYRDPSSFLHPSSFLQHSLNRLYGVCCLGCLRCMHVLVQRMKHLEVSEHEVAVVDLHLVLHACHLRMHLRMQRHQSTLYLYAALYATLYVLHLHLAPRSKSKLRFGRVIWHA